MRPILLVWVLAFAPSLAARTKGGANRTTPALAETPPGSWYPRLVSRVQPNAPPPTAKERLVSYLMSTVGPVPLLRAAATAGYEQGLDRPREWRLGTSGYARRVASQLAFNGVHQTLTCAAAAMLGEDNRYVPSSSTHFGPRLAHALIGAFAARRNGREVFSISSLAGVAGASLISREWMPPSWRHGRNVAESIGFTWLGIAGFNVFREFMPRP